MNSTTSIVISTYNQAEFIEDTIESILFQTDNNFEVILVNNSSTDNTMDVVSRYKKENFTIYENRYCGLSESRNFGASKAAGEWLLFIDGDDKIAPTFLEKTVATLKNNPSIGFAYTDTQHFHDSNGSWNHPEYNFDNLLQQNFVSSCSLIRRSAFEESGGYSKKNWGYFEDWQKWIHLGSLGWHGKHIPEKLFYYRIHKKSAMQSNRNAAFGQVYKSFIISQFPSLYPEHTIESAKSVLSLYPKNFMEWTFAEQEKYLEEI